MDKSEAKIYFVLDSKTTSPRLRIEDGKFYPDGTWYSWCEREYMPSEIFFKLCSECMAIAKLHLEILPGMLYSDKRGE